jgi:hypothetical protein
MSKTSGSAVARRHSLIQSAAFETLERRLVLDAEPSHVVSFEFDWGSQPKLQYTFDLEAERFASQVYLANLLTGQQYFVGDDEIYGPTYTESFPTPALGDGYYEAVLRGASSAEESETIDEYSSTFFFLPGDSNRDGSVDDTDQDVYTANYGGEGPFDFTQGDFNYDGMVDDADGDILAARYGTVLEPPPDAPNTLVLNTLGPREVTFTWQPPEDITPDGYKIFRSSDGGETDPYTLYKTINDGSATSWQEDNVPDGAKYYYRVRAFRTDYGNSITTNAGSIVTTLPAPDQLSVTRIGDTTVTLNWRDQSNNESGYEIWAQVQSPAGGGEGEWMQVGGAGGGQSGVSNEARSARVDGLSPDTIYMFRIRAVTAAQSSIWSPESTATTLSEGVPVAPEALQTTPLLDIRTMLLSWVDNSDIETGFTIERRSGSGSWDIAGTVGADVTEFTDTGLYSATDYEYRLSADGAGGSSTEEDTAIGVTDYGDGIIYEGNPAFGYEQMFDGVTASWSGPYDDPDFLTNSEISVTLNNLPEHYALEAGFGGMYFNSNFGDDDDADTVTLSGLDDATRTLTGTGMEFGVTATGAHSENSLTLTLKGSNWDDDAEEPEGWMVGGLTVRLLRYRVGVSDDVLTLNKEGDAVQVSVSKDDGTPAAGVTLSVENPDGVEAAGAPAITNAAGQAWLGLKGVALGMATYVLAAQQGGGKVAATIPVRSYLLVVAPSTVTIYAGQTSSAIATVVDAKGRFASGVSVISNSAFVSGGTTDGFGQVDLEIDGTNLRPTNGAANSYLVGISVANDPGSLFPLNVAVKSFVVAVDQGGRMLQGETETMWAVARDPLSNAPVPGVRLIPSVKPETLADPGGVLTVTPTAGMVTGTDGIMWFDVTAVRGGTRFNDDAWFLYVGSAYDPQLTMTRMSVGRN